MPARVDVAVAVLAAGRGARFGPDEPKVLARLGNHPLVAHALFAATTSGLTPVLLVVGNDADKVAAVAPAGVEVVQNPRWATGIASSLGAVLAAVADRAEVRAVAIGLADQPLVGADGYRRVADAYDRGARLAAATYGGVRGHPVLLARALWDEALRLDGDEGARALMRRHPVVEVPCDGTGEPTDVDAPADLERLETRWRSPKPSA